MTFVFVLSKGNHQRKNLKPPFILDIFEVTFVLAYFGQPLGDLLYAKNLNIYTISRQKVPKTPWNMLNTPTI